MKERVFLSNNQDVIIENFWMMHFLNVTDVLPNRVNCSGSTFNLTIFWRVVRDLRALFTACFLLDHVDYIWESFLWVTRQRSTRWWQPLCMIKITLFKQWGFFLDNHTIQQPSCQVSFVRWLWQDNHQSAIFVYDTCFLLWVVFSTCNMSF